MLCLVINILHTSSNWLFAGQLLRMQVLGRQVICLLQIVVETAVDKMPG